jgi:hypothetical protein
MANEILLLDSFDRYADTSPGDIASVWSSGGGTGPGRFFGGKCGGFYSFANGGGRSFRYSKTYQFQACMGSAVKLENLDAPIFTIARSAVLDPLTLWIDVTGRMKIYAGTGGAFGPGGTLLATGNEINTMVPAAWHYVEYAVGVGVGPQNLRVWVDGAEVLNAYVATYNNLGFDSFGLAFKNQSNQYDDFYAKNGLTPLGEIKIETLDLIADTVDAGWGVNDGGLGFSKLNEAQVDNDLTYIYSNTPGARSIFEVRNLSETPEAIKAVQVRTYARKLDAGYRSLKSVLKSGAGEGKGLENVLATTYTMHMDIHEKNPVTNDVWTEASVNAMKVGVELHA